MTVSHQSPQSTLPPLAFKTINTTTWGSVANTCTITDPYAHTNSAILIWVTGTTPQAGRWCVNPTQGVITITSSDSESSTLPISYIIL